MLTALLLSLALTAAPAERDTMSVGMKSGLKVLFDLDSGLTATHALMDRPMKVTHGVYGMEPGPDTARSHVYSVISEQDTLRVFSPDQYIALALPPALDISVPENKTISSPTILFDGSDLAAAPVFLIVRTEVSDIIVTWMPPVTTDSVAVIEPRPVSSVVYTSRSHDRYAPVSYNGSSPTPYLGAVTQVSCGGIPNTSTDLIIDGKRGVIAYEGSGLVSASIEDPADPDQPSAVYAVNCKSGMPIYIPLKR